MIAVLWAPAVTRVTTFATSLIHDDSGQGLAEYGLVLAFIAVLCVGVLMALGSQLKSILNNIGSSI